MVFSSLSPCWWPVTLLCVATSGPPQGDENDQIMRTGSGNNMPQQSCQEKQATAQLPWLFPFPSELHHQIMFTGKEESPFAGTQWMCPVLEGETLPPRPNDLTRGRPPSGGAPQPRKGMWRGQPVSCNLSSQ